MVVCLPDLAKKCVKAECIDYKKKARKNLTPILIMEIIPRDYLTDLIGLEDNIKLKNGYQ